MVVNPKKKGKLLNLILSGGIQSSLFLLQVRKSRHSEYGRTRFQLHSWKKSKNVL